MVVNFVNAVKKIMWLLVWFWTKMGFKKGDLIIGLKKSDFKYVYTNSNAILKIIDIVGDILYVKIVYKLDVGVVVAALKPVIFKVEKKYFRKLTKSEFSKYVADLL